MKYIDTSAFVKYFSEENAEKGSDKIKLIVDTSNKDDAIISSILLVVEVVSVFDKWVRLKLLEKDMLSETVGEFSNMLKNFVDDGRLVLEDVSSAFIVSAVDYVVKHHIPINDALHLASALLHRDEIECFISADKNLNEAAKKEGLNVVNPEEEN